MRNGSFGSTAIAGLEYSRPGSTSIFVACTGMVSAGGPAAGAGACWTRTPKPTAKDASAARDRFIGSSFLPPGARTARQIRNHPRRQRASTQGTNGRDSSAYSIVFIEPGDKYRPFDTLRLACQSFSRRRIDRLNLTQLRFVRAVADSGTFTGAAANCYVTQSTLSTAIAHLEKELGDRLFARTTRSVTLTPFGHRMLPLIDDVLRAQAVLVEAADGFLDPHTRLLRVGVCPLVESTRLERILGPYRDAHRKVKVVLHQTGDGKARRAMEAGELDFILGPATPAHRRLERALLYEDPLVYLRAGDRSLSPASRAAVHLQDIANDEFLLVHDACGLTRQTRHLFATRHLQLREYEGQAVSYQVLEEWARAGVGSAILPQSKLSAHGLGHPIVLGNGHRASLRFEAVWPRAGDGLTHLDAFAHHLKSARAMLERRGPVRTGVTPSHASRPHNPKEQPC